MQTKTFRISSELVNATLALANNKNLSLSAIVRLSLTQYVLMQNVEKSA